MRMLPYLVRGTRYVVRRMNSPRKVTHLVATRVSTDALETLQIGMLIERAESMQELLRPVVEDYAARLAAEPEVQAIRKQVEDYGDRKAGVDRLPPRRQERRRSQAPDDASM